MIMKPTEYLKLNSQARAQVPASIKPRKAADAIVRVPDPAKRGRMRSVVAPDARVLAAEPDVAADVEQKPRYSVQAEQSATNEALGVAAALLVFALLGVVVYISQMQLTVQP